MLLVTAYTVAQEFEPVVTMRYEENGSTYNEEISLQGGEIMIHNNFVTLVYDAEPSKNREFELASVKKMILDKKVVTKIHTTHEDDFIAYITTDYQLSISSQQALGRVQIYTISGGIIYDDNINTNSALISVAAYNKGVYIVRCGSKIVKVIR